jgi:hypothetical protein
MIGHVKSARTVLTCSTYSQLRNAQEILWLTQHSVGLAKVHAHMVNILTERSRYEQLIDLCLYIYIYMTK